MTIEKYTPEIIKDKKYDVIIIGSGIGGLTCGALLAREGKKVLILEQHYVAGGFTHTFKRKNYEWDVGVHYIGEVHRKNSILRKIFDDISDGELKWHKMDECYDRIFFPDKTYDFLAGREKFLKKMLEDFPEEEKGLKKFLFYIDDCLEGTQGFFLNKVLPRGLSDLLYPFQTRKFLKYAKKTTYDVLKNCFKDERLIGILTSQWGDYGLPPKESSFAICAMVFRHYLDGANYPIGGSARFVETINPLIERFGGQILIKAKVENILVKNKKAIGVKISDGNEILADTVISDAGVTNTFGKLLDQKDQKSFGLQKKLQKVSPSLSHICLYVGLKESSENLDLPERNFWIYPSYDHSKNIEDYLNHPDSELPVVYISFPSAKDPEWKIHHGETSTIEVISFAPFEWFQKWEDTKWKKRGDEYENYKKYFEKRLLDKLFEYVPQVKGRIDYCELSTPLSTKYFAEYDKGEIYGLTHTPSRFQQKWLRPKTKIKDLYLTGQDICTDGIGGAVFGGVLTASALLKKNVLGNIFQRQRNHS